VLVPSTRLIQGREQSGSLGLLGELGDIGEGVPSLYGSTAHVLGRDHMSDAGLWANLAEETWPFSPVCSLPRLSLAASGSEGYWK